MTSHHVVVVTATGHFSIVTGRIINFIIIIMVTIVLGRRRNRGQRQGPIDNDSVNGGVSPLRHGP